jgi:hypothetical protein
MKNKINLIFGISIISALACASLYFYFYFRLLNSQEEVMALHTKSLESKKNLEDLNKIENNLNKTLAESNKLNILFVQKDAAVSFIQNIEKIFKEVQVIGEVSSVSEEKFTHIDGGEQVKILTVLAVQGDWNNLIKLVGLLEQLPYRSTIEGVTFINDKREITKKDSKEVQAKKQWELKVRMYVWLTPVNADDDSGVKSGEVIIQDNESQ